MGKMRVVMVKPNERAEVVEIDATLGAYQSIVGGYIEAIYPFDDPVAIVCNDEGKFTGEPNRALTDDDGAVYDIIYGTFFICGLGEEDFAGLTEELADKYEARFKPAEYFIPCDDSLLIFRNE